MMHLNHTTSPSKGQHLTLSECIEIQMMKGLDKSNRFFAKALRRNLRSINAEVKRGIVTQMKLINGKPFVWKAYYAQTGQLIYEKHREACKPKYKLLKVERFIHYAIQKIKVEKWSPDVIVGRVKVDGLFEYHERVCAKTLYRYIDEGLMTLNNMDLWLKLQRNTKPKPLRERKRVLGQSIEQRSQEINERLSFGHWEIDTIVGKKNKHEPVGLTLTERLTRYQIVLKIPGKTEAAVNEAIKDLYQDNPWFSQLFRSITADNGSEFAGLSEVLDGWCDVYFTHPYSSWERGTNEKHNGILRRFIPKGKSLKNYSKYQIKQITHWMNHLPRKILNYQTPTEVILSYFNQIQST